MAVYVVGFEREPITIFNAASKSEAEQRVHQPGGLAEDMLVLNFWDGEAPIIIREATPIEYNHWQESRNRPRESNDPILKDEDWDQLVHCLWLKSAHDPTDVD